MNCFWKGFMVGGVVLFWLGFIVAAILAVGGGVPGIYEKMRKKFSASKESGISFHASNSDGLPDEVLRIASDGFYVRGVKLKQDENEVRKVWEAFTDWCHQMGIFNGRVER